MLVFGFLLGIAPAYLAQERIPFPENQRDPHSGSTRSEFGEIVVKGSDAYTRGTYCDFAVASRKSFQDLMKFSGRLKFPLIIDLKQVPGNRVRGHPVKPVIIVSHTYSPNIQVALCESFRFADLREELVRFFLMDYALRNHVNVPLLVEQRGSDLIPQWLWAGVSEAVGFREDGEPSELFAAIYQAGTMMGVDDIIKANPDEMSSLSRAVYRASAGGLVLTLLQHDAGPARMRNFIDALASEPQDQEALLRKYFPGVSDSSNSLEKWWALQTALLAKPTSLDIFSIPETEEKLKRALVVAFMEDRAAGTGGEGLQDGPRERRSLFKLFKKRGGEPEPDPDFESEPLGAEAIPFAEEQERVTYALEDWNPPLSATKCFSLPTLW